ncbi:MAG TPA: HAD-IIA family hydrolase [Crenotrichaceae bacterium]|nr:HAD-IIA family hydrolase [Crenotrichaceae bacterium]
MESLCEARAFIIDMDGVLWHGDQAVEGLVDFFHALNKKNIRFILATNNASLTPEQYVSKLQRMGVSVQASQILTSGMATALYLSEQVTPSATRVYVIGEQGARQPLLDQGFHLTGDYEIYSDDRSSVGADVVVCGKDEMLNWDKLATATLNIHAGARFIGTNADTTLPTERGLTHGNGAILAALEAATGVAPTIIGKPEPIMYRQALELLIVNPAQTIAIGDRLETDILGAVRAGIGSILVLSGVSTEAEADAVDYQPTCILEDIRAITRLVLS